MTTKFEKAARVIQRAQEAGCHASLENGFVVFRPVPPVDVLMDMTAVRDELKEIILDRDRDEVPNADVTGAEPVGEASELT